MAAAIAIMLPAPIPGHVVSSNDLVSAAPPFAGVGDPPSPQENRQLTDPAQVFRPDLHWARNEVRAGRLPTWDPLVFAGWPLLASQQAAPLFPLTGLSYALPYEASIAWRIIGLFVLAGLGTFLFCRLLGLRTAPAGLAAAAYGLCGPLVLWSMHPHSNVHAALPWMMLGAEAALRGRRWGVPLLAASVGCAALGGHPQSLLIDGLLVVAWVLTDLIRRRRDDRRLRRAARTAAGALLGMLSAAIVLLPLIELLGQSPVEERGGAPGSAPEALGRLVFPDLWGRPDWAFDYLPPGVANYLERTPYAGAVALVLALLGLVVKRDPPRWFFASGAVVSIVLAYDVPGLSGWLVEQWPLRLAAMGRATVLLSFCVALLAGLGLQAMLEEPSRLRSRRVRLAALVVVALPLAWLVVRLPVSGRPTAGVGFLPGFENPDNAADAATSAGVRWLVFAGIAAVLAISVARRRRAEAIGVVIVAVTALELAVGWQGYLPVMPTHEAELPTTPALERLRELQGSNRVVAGATLGGVQPLVPNTGQYFGLRDARGRGVPIVGRTATAWAGLGGEAAPNFAFVDPSDSAARRVLGAFGVRAALLFPGAPPPPRSRLLQAGSDGDVYELLGPASRAYVTCRWRTAEAEVAPSMVRSSAAGQLHERPVVEGANGQPPGCDSGAAAAVIVEDEAQRVEIDVSGASAGRVVLLDTFYPGWKAAVDGRKKSIEATNVAFRSVAIPAGADRVVFTYEPRSVRAGILVSGGAWAVIAILAVICLRRRPRRILRSRSSMIGAH